jgi:hypothetical protein
MKCAEFNLSNKERRHLRTIADDFVLYYSEKIKESYENDNFFESLKGELEDSIKYFNEKFQKKIPQWVFWEFLFNRLNKEFAKLS